MKLIGEAQDLREVVCWLLDDEAAGFVACVTIMVEGLFLASPGI